MNERVSNPFAVAKTHAAEQAVAVAESHRQEAEIQAAMVVAKRFPRDRVAAVDRILQACCRPGLADAAVYAYPRGKEVVTGPSIRLAEALAQDWGNMQFGIRELSQTKGESIVEAFAWDLETNTRQTKVFAVPHIRHTRAGAYALTDPRDIYEMVANQGARRLRACILGVIPGDVIDAAVRQCEITQENAEGVPAEQVAKLEAAFAALGVSRRQMETSLGHRLDSVVGAEVVRLRRQYISIRDGMAKPEDFFPPETNGDGPGNDGARTKTVADKVAQAAAAARGDDKADAQPQTASAAGGASGEPPDNEWPKEVDGGRWVDSRGVVFHEGMHGVSADGIPSVTQDGAFRRRRGSDPSAVAKYERNFLGPKPQEPELTSEDGDGPRGYAALKDVLASGTCSADDLSRLVSEIRVAQLSDDERVALTNLVIENRVRLAGS